MKVLVLGATGATGIHAVKQLLENGIKVKAIVRSPLKLTALEKNSNLEVITASILEMDTANLSKIVYDVDAVVSCLGHTLSFKGIWGKPYYLVTDATRKTCEAIKMNKKERATKYILMNTTACRDLDLHEKQTLAEQIVMSILRLLLPPQKDNEQAVHYLKRVIGKDDSYIEWIAVRPDTLINEESVTGYTVHNTLMRNPVFNAGSTSRINAGHFFMRLLLDEQQWEQWKYHMPVIYNEVVE